MDWHDAIRAACRSARPDGAYKLSARFELVDLNVATSTRRIAEALSEEIYIDKRFNKEDLQEAQALHQRLMINVYAAESTHPANAGSTEPLLVR
ncbi:MAG: hypothetical protein IV097_00485 [Burkholderiaceae bacterium]|nr:hypothetical protein [Burkholderiaceae bacterium]